MAELTGQSEQQQLTGLNHQMQQPANQPHLAAAQSRPLSLFQAPPRRPDPEPREEEKHPGAPPCDKENDDLVDYELELPDGNVSDRTANVIGNAADQHMEEGDAPALDRLSLHNVPEGKARTERKQPLTSVSLAVKARRLRRNAEATSMRQPLADVANVTRQLFKI